MKPDNLANELASSSEEEAGLLLKTLVDYFEESGERSIWLDSLPVLSIDYVVVKAAAKLYYFGQKDKYPFARLSWIDYEVVRKVLGQAVTNSTLPYLILNLRRENTD